MSGTNTPQLNESQWIKDLRDGDPTNDRQAIQAGLSELGFENSKPWVDTIWAIKDGQYGNALSGLLSLGKFEQAQEWLDIINSLQKEKYLEALDVAFSLAQFKDGHALAEAAIAVKNGNFIEAFYDGFDLLEGGSDLKEAFKALKRSDIQEFVSSMRDALPLLRKLI